MLDVAVGDRAAVLEFLACEDQALFVWRDALATVDATLDRVDGIAGVHVDGNGFASESLDKDADRTSTNATKLGFLHLFSGGARESVQSSVVSDVCRLRESVQSSVVSDVAFVLRGADGRLVGDITVLLVHASHD